MADFSALKASIQAAIRQNGQEAITGDILQDILIAVVETLGDSAISDLQSSIVSEGTVRQNADGTLQTNINNEALARQSADSTLHGEIVSEGTAREAADTALGGRIDGLQAAINGINTKLAEGYIYVGIATPSTNPGTPSGKVFYIAVSSGTYTNFSNLTVVQGINIIKYNGSAWSKDVVYAIDARPKKNSQNLVTSGGIFDNMGALDVSELNATENPHTLAQYADLSAALAAIPTDYQKGGMSVKFVQSSDNKYVQARCLAQNFTTDTTQWQRDDTIDTVQLGDIDIQKCSVNEGYIASNTKTWVQSSVYNSVFIKVTKGTLISITAGANNTLVGFLSSMPAMSQGESVSLIGSLTTINAEATAEIKVPDTGKVLYVYTGTNMAAAPASIACEIFDYQRAIVQTRSGLIRIELKEDDKYHFVIDSANGAYITYPNNTSVYKGAVDINITDLFGGHNDYWGKIVVDDAGNFYVRGLSSTTPKNYYYVASFNIQYGFLQSDSLIVFKGNPLGINVATESVNGLMSKEDKVLLNDLQNDDRYLHGENLDIDYYTQQKGYVSSLGKWVSNVNYRTIVIPVFIYSVYSIKANNTNAVVCFLTDYPTFVDDSEVGLIGTPHVIAANTTEKLVTPENAKYISILMGSYKPSSVLCSADYITPDKKQDFDNISNCIFKKDINLSSYENYNGYIQSPNIWKQDNNTHSVIIKNPYLASYQIEANQNRDAIVCFLDEMPTFVNNSTVSIVGDIIVIGKGTTLSVKSPKEAKYINIRTSDYVPALIQCYIIDDYDYITNYPIIPNELFVLDDAVTPLFKHSMFLDPYSVCDMVLTTEVNNRRKAFEVGAPLNIEYNQIGGTARISLVKPTSPSKYVYKDIAIHKVQVSSLNGKTPKLLLIGSSLTHGNRGAQTSPVYLAPQILHDRYSITPTMIGTFAPYGVFGEGRGVWSWQALIGVNNNPYYPSYYGFKSVGGYLEHRSDKTTTQFMNPFTFPATASDKENHPELCFTNKFTPFVYDPNESGYNQADWDNNSYENSEPDHLCYADATAEEKANYHYYIFDFQRYINLWGDNNHTPDVIAIFLGANDFSPAGVMDFTKVLWAMQNAYSRIRSVLPNVKIMFVTAQNTPLSFQTNSNANWVYEIAPFITRQQLLIKGWQDGGDANVYEAPMYATGCRWLSFNAHIATQPQDISEINNVKVMDVGNSDTHILDGVGTDGYWEYLDAYFTAIACIC